MLTRLTKGLRSRAAFALVLVYALCVLAPAAAFAFGDGTRAAHCLTDDHHGVSTTHAHSGAASSHGHADSTTSHGHAIGGAQEGAHEHASADGENGQVADAKCCGLMCLPAIPATAVDLAVRPPVATHVQFVATHLTSREPERFSRPPDFSLSF